jgi:hypothetical protein
MPDDLEWYEHLPFPPGESPFQIKGVAYKGHISYVDQYVPGGMAGSIEMLHDPRLRAFYAQPFLAASMYDVFPLVAMGYVCARITGKTFPDFLRIRSRYQAEQDIGGVYRWMLRMASPMAVALKLPALTSQYFNFVQTTVRETGPNAAEVMSSGLPRALAAWYAPIAETYVLVALEFNGARRPRGKLYPFRGEGSAHGVEVGNVRFDVSWGDR